MQQGTWRYPFCSCHTGLINISRNILKLWLRGLRGRWFQYDFPKRRLKGRWFQYDFPKTQFNFFQNVITQVYYRLFNSHQLFWTVKLAGSRFLVINLEPTSPFSSPSVLCVKPRGLLSQAHPILLWEQSFAFAVWAQLKACQGQVGLVSAPQTRTCPTGSKYVYHIFFYPF